MLPVMLSKADHFLDGIDHGIWLVVGDFVRAVRDLDAFASCDVGAERVADQNDRCLDLRRAE